MNEGRWKRTVVITTKVGVSASSHILRGRWCQLGVTCLIFISSAKSHGHSPIHTSPKGFEPGLVLWRLKRTTNWVSMAWRLSKHVEGIYILFYCLYIVYLYLFEWILIGRKNHIFRGSFKMTSSYYKVTWTFTLHLQALDV